MNREEARSILAASRPGDSPGDDPRLAEALALAARDPELGAWLENQRAFHDAAQRALRATPVPAGLADRILAARKTARPDFRPRPSWSPWLLSAAAAVAALVLAAALYLRPDRGQDAPADFATFRSRMVRTVVREYRMDVVTNDLAAIRGYLAGHAAPADFELPPRLAALSPMGAGLLSWQGNRVSMVCLNGGKLGTLFLFIVPSNHVAGGRPDTTPELAQVNRLGTLGWTRGGRTYVLATTASAEQLRDFL